ncbi:hypothetical protein [Microbacterium sp. NPDC058345]|uniref:hypothetical protein n=1 Tax=Microbacterium sp. NPDC058345 TaxID=3346455 RepID=UPI00366332E2
MSQDQEHRYTLNQVSPDDWVIFDTSLSDDTHRLVACVSEHDGFVEVRWFRDVALPNRFLSRKEALTALTAADREPALALH